MAHSLAFVRAKIVHDHDIAGLQGRNQDLLNVELEGLAVDRLIDEPRSGDTVVAPVLGTIFGRADLNSLVVYQNGLSVNPTPVSHARHADVIGWDLASTETRLIAIKLAAAAQFKKK